ncbi:MAG: site-specific DNA-methyltransferase [Pseudomonadota bacterium]
MSTTNDNKRQQLISKLREMFQMDQADLDFGIYRIMNAKRDEISQFLEQDLLPTLRTTLQEFQPAGLADKQKELADAIANAKKLKIDADSLEVVQQLKADLAEGGDLDRMEDQVYSDLYTFFSRYYQDGDFLSLRRYKEGVYAMPYEGEEIKLHWANADQYYIKTAESFTRYAFKTAQGRVRFELVAASTERDNNKATADNERRFILAAEPLAMDGDELIIRFEYRPDADKRKQKELSTLAVTSLLALPEGAPLTAGVPQWSVWRAALGNALPSDNNKTRTVFEKHLTDYTAKNTFDYFIHKDLGAFLKRELDFFIKNEVMHLDDIEEDSVPRVESYLARIKAMRRISHKLIAFLAQLENFQQKLWLKKRLVLDTQWLITLDEVPESFYVEICEKAELPVLGWDGQTRSQRQEWVELFAIDEIKGDLAGAVRYSVPLTPGFLAANPSLVLDTALFDSTFKDRIIASLDSFRSPDAMLVQGDNFQALSLLDQTLHQKVKCIYIDPPYNTGVDGFIYKDSFKSSTWVSMIRDRLQAARPLLQENGVLFASINEIERTSLEWQLRQVFGSDNLVAEVIWARDTVSNNSPTYSKNHEYIEVVAKNKSLVEADRSMFRETRPGFVEVMAVLESFADSFPPTETVAEQLRQLYDEHKRDHISLAMDQGQSKTEAAKTDPWKGLYPYKFVEYRTSSGEYVTYGDAKRLAASLRVFREVEPSMPSGKQAASIADATHENYRFYTPLNPDSSEHCPAPKRGWAFPFRSIGSRPSFESYAQDKRLVFKGKSIPQQKYFLHEVETMVSNTVIRQYSDGEPKLEELFGRKGLIDNPKPPSLIEKFIHQTTSDSDMILDFFAGSGTTGQAVIEANRKDKSHRSFVLVEVGAYFDSVLVPRIKKVVFSPEWSAGKPNRAATLDEIQHSPGIIKVLRLESYEDTLNNLSLTSSDGSKQAALLDKNPGMRESYMLSYMLDIETREGLVDLKRFDHPFDTKISVVRGDEVRLVEIDLIETFNHLLGLRVQSMRRTKDVYEVVGVTPTGDLALILWRDVTDVDNDALDEWFRIQAYSSRDKEFDLIYVNGDNNIENLRRVDETWKIRLIEESFLGLMFGSAAA